MSSRRKTHTAAFDRCVKAVKRRGGAANPDAVCQASMGPRALLKKKKRSRPRARRSNPAPKLFIIKARRDDGPELTYTGEKFSASGTPVKFPTKALADTWVRYLRREYTTELRRYRLRVA